MNDLKVTLMWKENNNHYALRFVSYLFKTSKLKWDCLYTLVYDLIMLCSVFSSYNYLSIL